MGADALENWASEQASRGRDGIHETLNASPKRSGASGWSGWWFTAGLHTGQRSPPMLVPVSLLSQAAPIGGTARALAV
jgi:hypothetical protein